MAAPRPSKTRIGNHVLKPETLMLGYGYDPALSEGAVKPPVFLTSTFVFRSAEEGRDFFDYTSGRKQPPPGSNAGLVYSRFNHPNSEIVEDRLAVYEGAETCGVFASGMAAITTLLETVPPGGHVAAPDVMYYGTRDWLKRLEAKGRIALTLFDPVAPGALARVQSALDSGSAVARSLGRPRANTRNRLTKRCSMLRCAARSASKPLPGRSWWWMS